MLRLGLVEQVWLVGGSCDCDFGALHPHTRTAQHVLRTNARRSMGLAGRGDCLAPVRPCVPSAARLTQRHLFTCLQVCTRAANASTSADCFQGALGYYMHARGSRVPQDICSTQLHRFKACCLGQWNVTKLLAAAQRQTTLCHEEV